MGKLLHKLLHGILPAWLYTGFRHRKLLHFRLRHGIHFISASKSSAPTSSYSSSPLNTELVALLMDMDQDTYYYSQSEDEQEHPMTGSSSKHTSSVSIGSESQREVDDHDAQYCPHADQLRASHGDSTKENMGISAPLAAASIMKGRLQEDKHGPPIAASMEFEYATSASRIIMQIQHDDDDHHHHHNEHDVHSHHHHHQQQQNGYLDQSHGNQHADDGPQCQAHHDICHVNQYNHDHQIYGSHHNHLCTPLHEIVKQNTGSDPMPSLTASANKGNQHDNSHHQHYRQDEDHHQHHANDYQHQKARFLGSKRKGMCLDGDDLGEEGKDNQKCHCSMRTVPCLKRHKGANERCELPEHICEMVGANVRCKLPGCICEMVGASVGCELPERICEMVGDGSAVVQYSYQEPHFVFWESMVEMIVCNGLWDVGKLEFLLHCYLTLNDPHLHHAIHTSFLQVLKDLQPA